MPIPRYRDADGDYEIYLYCPNCHWTVTKDRVTMNWKQCRRCDHKLETQRVDYSPNPYKPGGYR